MEFRFASPLWLWLLLSLPIFWAWRVTVAHRFRARMRYSGLDLFQRIPRVNPLVQAIPTVLRSGALFFLIIALARPQAGNVQREVLIEGVDIMVALDVSESMSERDFPPHLNRLEAAKRVTSEFIDGRETDRIGLVIFAASSFTVCPLTIDYDALNQMLNRVRLGIVAGNRTAIGQGILNAVHRLRDSEAQSKVIILVTDGMDNAGQVSPMEIAQIAGDMGMKIYPIGIVPRDPRLRNRSVDPALLQEIARVTGGKAFLAQNAGALSAIFDEIDQLERSEVEYNVFAQWDERMVWPLMAGLLLLLLEILLRSTRLRTLP